MEWRIYDYDNDCFVNADDFVINTQTYTLYKIDSGRIQDVTKKYQMDLFSPFKDEIGIMIAEGDYVTINGGADAWQVRYGLYSVSQDDEYGNPDSFQDYGFYLKMKSKAEPFMPNAIYEIIGNIYQGIFKGYKEILAGRAQQFAAQQKAQEERLSRWKQFKKTLNKKELGVIRGTEIGSITTDPEFLAIATSVYNRFEEVRTDAIALIKKHGDLTNV